MKFKLRAWLVTITLFALLASGCGAHQFSGNIYEGIRSHEESQKSTPLEKPGAVSPTYEEYERERRALSPRDEG